MVTGREAESSCAHISRGSNGMVGAVGVLSGLLHFPP